MLKKIFEGQLFQTFFAMIFIFIFLIIFNYSLLTLKQFIVIAILCPLIHQLYVAMIWRIELYTKYFTRKSKNAFLYYKIGFVILFALRITSIFIVSILDQNTLYLNKYVNISIIIFLSIIVLYAFYSVLRYFSIDRAFGLDHFDENIRKTGIIKKGIFKYTQNGMYGYAILFVYIIPLIYSSRAGLFIAVFNNIFLWIHYFCTEKVDMNEIYK